MFDKTIKVSTEEIARALAATAAVALPPRRVEDGDNVYYIRPSNVLRINPGYQYGYQNVITAEIETTDGKEIRFTVLYPDDLADALGWEDSSDHAEA